MLFLVQSSGNTDFLDFVLPTIVLFFYPVQVIQNKTSIVCDAEQKRHQNTKSFMQISYSPIYDLNVFGNINFFLFVCYLLQQNKNLKLYHEVIFS